MADKQEKRSAFFVSLDFFLAYPFKDDRFRRCLCFSMLVIEMKSK